MKHQFKLLVIILGYIMITTVSCEKNESFTQIKAIENQIYNEIKTYRTDNGISADEPFVNQPIMFKEAQIFSAKMALSDQGLDTTGIAYHWEIINDKIGGENNLSLIQSTTANNAVDIVSAWTADSTYSKLLLGNFTQCGVGLETGDDQINYVTVFLMLYRD